MRRVSSAPCRRAGASGQTCVAVTSCRRRGAYIGTVHDVLSDLLAVWRAGGTAGVGTVVRTFRSAPRLPGAAMVVAPDGTVERLGVRRLRRGRGLRAGRRRWSPTGRAACCSATGSVRRRRLRRRPDLRRDHRHLRRTGVAGHVSRAGGRRRRHRGAPTGRGRHRHRPSRRRVGRAAAGGAAGRGRADRWAPRAPTTPSPTTPAGCSPPAAPRCSPTAPTGSAGARAWRCSSPATRRGPGCWCSAPSTSPAAVARQGSFLGYRVTVCDARPVFATPARFPDADEVVVDWPHRYLRRAGGRRARSTPAR